MKINSHPHHIHLAVQWRGRIALFATLVYGINIIQLIGKSKLLVTSQHHAPSAISVLLHHHSYSYIPVLKIHIKRNKPQLDTPKSIHQYHRQPPPQDTPWLPRVSLLYVI